MTKKKLLLINPTYKDIPNASWIKYYDIPPMALAYLAGLTPESWDIDIIDENYDTLDFSLCPDLVGITSFTYNINRAYEIAKIFRQKGAKVVLGGIHASMMPDEAVQFTDSVVCGEAENVWQRLLKDFEEGSLKKIYGGTPADLENLVIPRRDLFKHKVERHAMLTSRGCPLNCEFCSVTAFNGARYRRRPTDKVLDELQIIPSRYITFLDDNFGGLTQNDLDRTKEILKGVVERGIKIKWGTQTGINYVDDHELLVLSRKSGCIGLFIGIESVNEQSLAGTVRKGNIVKNIQRVKEAVKRFHDYGIAVVGAFVLGNDEDDKTIFERTIDFIFVTKLDCCNLAISTPYPGTRLFARIKAESRLLYHNFPQDWQKFNFINVTYQPKNMSPDKLQKGFFMMTDVTTNLKVSIQRSWNTFMMSKNIFSSVVCYSWNRGFFRNNQIFKRLHYGMT